MADDEICKVTKNDEGLDEETCYRKTRSRLLDDSLTKSQSYFAEFRGNAVGYNDIVSNSFFCVKNRDASSSAFTDCILHNSSKNDYAERINISKLQDEYECKSVTMLSRDDTSMFHDDVFTCYTDRFVENNKNTRTLPPKNENEEDENFAGRQDNQGVLDSDSNTTSADTRNINVQSNVDINRKQIKLNKKNIETLFSLHNDNPVNRFGWAPIEKKSM